MGRLGPAQSAAGARARGVLNGGRRLAVCNPLAYFKAGPREMSRGAVLTSDEGYD